MGRPLTLALLAAGAAACVTPRAIECKEHGGVEWREVQSPHFRVETPLPEAEAREVAKTLEQLLQVTLWVVDYGVKPRKVRAIAVREDTLRGFGYGQYVGISIGGASTIVFESSVWRTRKGAVPSVATHELTHAVLEQAYPALPRWLNEGMAVYVETATLKDERTAKLGTGLWGYAESVWLKGPLPMAGLWEWGQGPEPSEEQVTRRYATAWAIVHYLINHDRERFLALLERLKQPGAAKEAFEAVFPGFEAEKYAAVQRHMDGGKFMAVTLALPEGPPEVQVRPLSPRETHLARATVWGNSPLRKPEENAARRREEVALALAVEGGASEAQGLELLARGEADERALLQRFPRSRPVLRAVTLRIPVGHAGARKALADLHQLLPGDGEVLARLLLEEALGEQAQREPARFAQFEALAREAAPRVSVTAGLAAYVAGDFGHAKAWSEAARAQAAGGADAELEDALKRLEWLCRDLPVVGVELSRGCEGGGGGGVAPAAWLKTLRSEGLAAVGLAKFVAGRLRAQKLTVKVQVGGDGTATRFDVAVAPGERLLERTLAQVLERAGAPKFCAERDSAVAVALDPWQWK